MDDGMKSTNPKDAVGSTKVGWSYLPWQVLGEVAVGMQEGGFKYGRSNYREAGVRGSVYVDATLRHIIGYWEGQDIDPDSKIHHISKAIASLTVMRDAMMNDLFTDDRPPKVKDQEWIPKLNQRVVELLKKYPDPVPPVTELGLRAKLATLAEETAKKEDELSKVKDRSWTDDLVGECQKCGGSKQLTDTKTFQLITCPDCG